MNEVRVMLIAAGLCRRADSGFDDVGQARGADRVPAAAHASGRALEPELTRPNPVVYKPHPLTQDPKRRITPDDIRRYEKELSNWGRWGANDTRGALNLITPAKSAAAARLVTEGVSVNLQHFVEFVPSADNWRFWPAEKWLTSANPADRRAGQRRRARRRPVLDARGHAVAPRRDLSLRPALRRWPTSIPTTA